MVVEDVVYRGGGATFTFSDGTVGEAQYKAINGVLSIIGLTDNQLEAVALFYNNIHPDIKIISPVQIERRVFGYLTIQDNMTETPIGATSTPVKALCSIGSENLSDLSVGFSNVIIDSVNRIYYDGIGPRVFHITIQSSLSAPNNNTVGLHIGINGTVTPINAHLTTNGAGRVENSFLQIVIQLNTGDYVEIFVDNVTATNPVTLSDATIIIREV